jgi:chemotaxis protein MotB
MRRKKKQDEPENLERWLVSYADFITLLFAFFTVMYALSLTDKAKYKTAVENIQRAFLTGAGVFPLHGSPMVPFDKPPDRGSQVPPSPSERGDSSKAEQETLKLIAEQVRGLFRMTSGVGLSATDVEAVKSEEGYKIRLGEAVLFRPGSDKIRRESIPFLFELARRLHRLGLPIQVEGHSDITPAATHQTNWQLSMDRAYNVVQFFVGAVDFPPNKISLTGYGDTQPIASNETPEGRAKNRRVEISIITPNREIASLPW